MKQCLRFLVFSSIMLLVFAPFSVANAQCSGFRTQTQGGWGSKPSGNNPGTYLHNNFAKAFPKGVTIGCTSGNTLTFNNPQSITDFIPQGGKAIVLPKGNFLNEIDDTSVIWGQTLAASLNVGFDSTMTDFSENNSYNTKDLVFKSGSFKGKTVLFVIQEANKVIGGCSSSYSLSDLNDALSTFNENYVDGEEDKGDFACAKMAPPTTYSTTNAAICNGQSFLFNGTTYTQAGTYTATLKNAQGGDSIATLNLTVNSLPTVQIQQTGAFTSCNTGTIQLTATGANTYEWSNNSNTASINITSAGTYSVRGTNSNGCANSASITIAPFSYPATVVAPGVTSMCSDTPSVRLRWRITNSNNFPLNFSYTIHGSGVNQNETVAANSTIFIFTNTRSSNTLIVSYADNACSTRTVTRASGMAACNANIVGNVSNTTCNKNNGNITLTVSGGSQPYQFLWNTGATTQNLTNIAPGNYSVQVTTASGGKSNANFTVTNTGTPSNDTINASICNGSSYLFQGNSYTQAGTYFVTYTNVSGCDSIKTLILTVNNNPATPTLKTVTQPTCTINTGNVTLKDAAEIGVQYGINGVYQQSPTFSSLAPGNYLFTIKNSSGCVSNALAQTITAAVNTVNTTISYNNSNSICAKGIVNPTISGVTGGTFSVNPSVAGFNAQTGSLPLYAMNSGNYTINYQFGSGSCAAATSATITVLAQPIADIKINGSSKQPQLSNNFSLQQFNNNHTSNVNWQFGDGTSSNSAVVNKTYQKAGIYNVSLIAQNNNGCKDTAYKTVIVTGAPKMMAAIDTCNYGLAPKQIIQNINFAQSSSDWTGNQLKSATITPFDTSLGTLTAVKVIANGNIHTTFKVEVLGNMAPNVTRLVYSQTTANLHVAGGSLCLDLNPTPIVDTFSAGGFDGTIDFNGRSGKDFGNRTSSITDSTMIKSAIGLADFKGTQPINFQFFGEAKDSSFFPTGNAASAKSTSFSGNIQVIYYYCSNVSDSVSSGNLGGVESKSLGDAITKRVVNKALQNKNTSIDYAKAIIFESGNSINGIERGVLGINDVTLKTLMPNILSGFNGYFTSPEDLIGITNANEVVSIDYTFRNKAKAVAFATKTAGEVYNHTKQICDRLKGSKLLETGNLTIDGIPFIQYKLASANGDIEYATSFSVGVNSGSNNFTIQSKWLTKDYGFNSQQFNFQIWAVTPELVEIMTADVLKKLKTIAPISFNLSNKNGEVPSSFIMEGKREQTKLILKIRNNTQAGSGYFDMNMKENEQAPIVTKRIAFTCKPMGDTTIAVNIADSYESDVWMYIGNELKDLVYMGDGSWSIDYNTAQTKIKQFTITNSNNQVKEDEYAVFRNVSVNAITNSYVSLFKLLKGGGIATDLSSYQSLKFTAEGGNNLRITLVKNSIKDWKNQYSIVLPLSKQSKEYTINLESLVSALNNGAIKATDVTSIVFNIEVSGGRSTEIINKISNIRFSKEKAAIEATTDLTEVTVYPNPSKGIINCIFQSQKAGSATVKLVDLSTGRMLMQQNINMIIGKNNVQLNATNHINQNSLVVVVVEAPNANYTKKQLLLVK